MTSTKDTKSLQDKLKQFFRRTAPGGVKSHKGDFVITEEIRSELCKEAPLATRLKTVKELSELVLAHKVEDKGIEKLYLWVKDLLGKENSTEVRHLTLNFLQCMVKGQYDRLGILRAHFFRVIKVYDHPEDVVPRFELLQTLTEKGRDLLHFEEEIGQFLLNWYPELSRVGKTKDYLEMVLVLIKYNAAYLDHFIGGYVRDIDVLCSTPKTHWEIVMLCLELLEAIVAYSSLPNEVVPNYIAALCRTVNGEMYCQRSWKVMRNFLGTHMGYAALFTLCRILQEPSLKCDCDLIRGAIFYIHMGLWGTQPLPNLRCSPSAILPAVLDGLRTNHPAVTYEVVCLIHPLVNKFAMDLHNPEWDIITEIFLYIIYQIDSSSESRQHHLVSSIIHEIFTTIENYIEVGSFFGSVGHFYNVIGACSANRPEPSVFRLITYLAQEIVPTSHLWFSNLYELLQRYFRNETRTNIRLKAISVLSKVIKLNRKEYEDELIERIVLPHLIHIVNDTDPVVRISVVELLIDLCMDCSTRRCLEILEILEKLLARPFEQYTDIPANEDDIQDVHSAVLGLINVFTVKIHRLPSIHAVTIFKMLITVVEQHYLKPKVFEDCNEIRYKILLCFLKMRADSLYHVGCTDSNGLLKFSSYICVMYRDTERSLMSSPPPMSPAISQQNPCVITHVPLRRVFKIFITCLRQERDWEVLSLVLHEISQILQNKAMILTKNGNNEIHLLVDALISLVKDRTLPESLKKSMKLSRADFHASVLFVLSNLTSYHAYLDSGFQQKIIRCLMKYGLVPKCAKQCIVALTICILEMRDVMVKMLSEVLLDLSKISATVNIAIPILEFLSTLSKLPDVFANFVGDQYMAVFAISLPYTNPFKYNHYIVSLAHHVIAVWFLKCRLPFRRDFISYITKGLQTNVLFPFEETNALKSDLSKLNEDSSNRKRSSSLTEQTSRRRERTSTIVRPDFKPNMNKNLSAFYEELTETCIDLMARYTFSSCSALPRRSATTEYLLTNGYSMSWFLGNKLITVTTSGCTQKALKKGLCDKCWSTCRLACLKSRDTEPPVVTKTVRRSSADDAAISRIIHQNSAEKSNNNTTASSPLEENKKIVDKLEQLPSKLQQIMTVDGTKPTEKQTCVCWCQGWAEIYVRRATGDMSWIMQIQNQSTHQLTMYDYPLSEFSTMYVPSAQSEEAETLITASDQCEDNAKQAEDIVVTSTMPISIPGSPVKHSTSRQNSKDSIDDVMENLYDDEGKSRTPVRRSNSSPEMSASWKNPFAKPETEREDQRIQDDEGTKKAKTFTKDMRVSCEAIPEEISGMGTTPPSNESTQTTTTLTTTVHPALMSCHSYPGSASTAEQTVVPKAAHTVPPSPNVVQMQQAPLNLHLAQRGILKSKSDSGDSVGSEKNLERPTTLSTIPNLPPLATKPPQSPPQTSPRLSRHVTKEGHEIQKSSSLNLERTHSLKVKDKKADDLAQMRDRGYTISVMNTARKPRLENLRQAISSRKDMPRSGISPSFVFLQLYHSSQFGSTSEKPLLVTSSEVVQRAVKVLDFLPPYETHGIGVIYIRENQSHNEVDILRNQCGSMRYIQFLQNLGTLIKLQDVDPQVVYLGGLNQNGSDGNFAYIWQDDVIKVSFHVATLMPNKETDPNCTSKKAHIGNDYVIIVYNESNEDYNINTLKSQFNFASIIIHPLDHNTNKIITKTKDELTDLIGTSEPKIVSDQNVALIARQLALHADLASLVSKSLKISLSDPYASNWLERLRKIKNVQAKILQESKPNTTPVPEDNNDATSRQRKAQMEDFSEYT